jgi:beta-lactam-binding protein with PASTA domain
MPVGQARMVLLRSGFREVQANPAPSEQPANIVTAQSPAPGPVLQTPAVLLTVSDGSLTRVPDLTGQTPAQALRTLARRLQLGFASQQLTDARPAGQIVATRPGPGALVRVGSRVDYMTAIDQVVVPDLVGRTTAQAGAILAKSRLQLGAGSSQFARSAPGLILSTNPPAGAPARIGGQVSYALSTDQLAVPNVVGLTEAAASSALDQAGFAHATQPVGQGEQKLDKVASQDPASGAVVSVSTLVRLTMQQQATPPPSSTTVATNQGGPGASSGPGGGPGASSGPGGGHGGGPGGGTGGSPGAAGGGSHASNGGSAGNGGVVRKDPGTQHGPFDGLATPLIAALAGAGLVGAAVFGWSASWPLRTTAVVVLQRGLTAAPAGREPPLAAPETRLHWEVRLEPPTGEEAGPVDEPATEKATEA